ncbi:Fur family transcriptional regulator [Thermodesulfatator autotrophicus]|nr:transcriptional repressor [Thermodesulfatator autotrophicus]
MKEYLKKFEEICRQHGIKVTPQRLAIYRELLTSKDHPSAVNIYEKVKEYFPHISLDTVNRTLLLFADLGLAQIIEGRGDPKRFDPNLSPHHHFRCIKCGRIIDFYCQEYDQLKVPEDLQKKYIITRMRVNIEGICDECQKKTS